MFAQNENSDEKKRLNFEGNKNKFEIDDTIINENNNSISFRNKCFFSKEPTTVNLAERIRTHTNTHTLTKCDNQINTLTSIERQSHTQTLKHTHAHVCANL